MRGFAALLLSVALAGSPVSAADRASGRKNTTELRTGAASSVSLAQPRVEALELPAEPELRVDDLLAIDSPSQEKLAVILTRSPELSIRVRTGPAVAARVDRNSRLSSQETPSDLTALFNSSAARRRERIRAVIESTLAEFTPRQLATMPQAELAAVIARLQHESVEGGTLQASGFSAEETSHSSEVPSPVPHAGHDHAHHDHHHETHDHDHHGHHHHEIDASNPSLLRAARRALAIQAFATAVELFGGLSIGSIALTADSLHLAADLGLTAAPLISLWILRHFGSRGWSKGRVGAAIALGGSAVIAMTGIEAIERLLSPVVVPGGWAIAIAFVGLASNWLASRLLRPHQDHDLSVKAAFQHFLVDVAGSIVIIASGLALLLTGWLWLDPLANFTIIGIVFYFNWGLVRDSWRTLFSTKKQENSH